MSAETRLGGQLAATAARGRMSASLSRRDIALGAAGLIAVAQFLRLAVGGAALAAPVAPIAESWARGLADLARDVKTSALSVTQWQDAVERLNRTLPIQDLLAYVNFERVQARLEALGRGEHRERIWLPGVDPTDFRFRTDLYIVPHGDAIPPHGHNALVTAHLILRGRARVRIFDRIEDRAESMMLRPTRDERVGAGTTISMSDERDNVHWFVAEDGPVFTFDAGTRAGGSRPHAHRPEADGRIYIDPTAGQRSDGLIEAAVINRPTGVARFGRGSEQ